MTDQEHDEINDQKALNLPAEGSREDRESLGDYDYNNRSSGLGW